MQQGSNQKDFKFYDSIFRANTWGREGASVENEMGQQLIVDDWLHSDIKNMAYYFIYPVATALLT